MSDNSEVISLDFGQKPDVSKLIESYEQNITDLGPWNTQQEINREVRFCEWDNQDKRTNKKIHKEALPWKGASDLRVFIVDQQINADVATLKMALRRADIQANPVEGGDIRQAGLVSAFMRWLVYSQMTELNCEAELLANYYLQEGLAIVNTYWKREVVSSLKEVTIEELSQVVAQSNPEFDLAGAINDLDFEQEAIDALLSIFPDIGRRPAKKMIKDLRETGSMFFPSPEVVCNRPAIRARSLGRDIFFPINTIGSIQNAPYVHSIDYYTPESLTAKIKTDDWDKKWVDKAISTQGKVSHIPNPSLASEDDPSEEELIPVVCTYYKAIDKNGVEAIYYCVYSPDVPDEYGFAEMLNYSPARYPFRDMPRERVGPRVVDTRGYTEVAQNFQQEIKAQRDMRTDSGALRTIPPREGPPNRKPVNFGPGSWLPTRIPGEYRFADVPQFDPGSVEIEQTCLQNMKAYFGEGDNEQANRAIKQGLVDNWLQGWAWVFRDLYSLHRQFGSELETFRVIGASQEDMQSFDKSQASEKYDFYISFSALSLDPENYMKQLDILGKAMSSYNHQGSANFDGLLRLMANQINPTIADEVILPKQAATQKEIKETQQDFASMMDGIPVDPPPNSNAELRIGVMQQIIDGTPDFPATDIQNTISQSPEKQNRINKYMEKLQFQIEQRKNAQIGAIGGVPGGGIPSQGL